MNYEPLLLLPQNCFSGSFVKARATPRPSIISYFLTVVIWSKWVAGGSVAWKMHWPYLKRTQPLTNLELGSEFPLSELDRERFLRQSGSSTDHSLQQFFALLCLRLPRWTTSQKRFGLETLGIPTHSFEITPALCSAFRCLQRTGSLLCKEILNPRFQISPPTYYASHQQRLYQLWQSAVWTHGTFQNPKPQ